MKDEAIRIPRIDINDDFVMVGQWLVENGEYVMENQPVAVLETSKKTVEIFRHNAKAIYASSFKMEKKVR